MVLSVLHAGDIKNAVGEKLTGMERNGIAEMMYELIPPWSRGLTLAEIRALPPEQQNEVLRANLKLRRE